MVALNFQKQFAPDIRSGRKTQTIRKSARCTTGDELQLYTGQRTKACSLIGTATCAICEPFTITEDFVGGGTGWWASPSDAEYFARIDGFENIEAMRAWFRDRYGLPFHGYRIMWHSFRAAPLEAGKQ